MDKKNVKPFIFRIDERFFILINNNSCRDEEQRRQCARLAYPMRLRGTNQSPSGGMSAAAQPLLLRAAVKVTAVTR